MAETIVRKFDPNKWVLVPTRHALERLRKRELSPSADVPEAVHALRRLASTTKVLIKNDVWVAVGTERTLVLSEMRTMSLEKYQDELKRHLSRLHPTYTVYVITAEGCRPTSAGQLDVDDLATEFEYARFSGEARTLVLAREGEKALAVVTVRPPRKKERKLIE
ncbi:hypothetical protein [Methanopyrus kandleri]|uniref:Uncharacterized protein n=2 Tax=Methanopyrus kandleri TaxID=2320 RepID=Q8TYE8_METKA|nr:hypothetical protein [Methanopyrus kandleri]AAM01567.1 Uncharacterized protein MK0352 [Methanopyrus kandleri AV19]HII70495.1 hypothetical protein [Methanopyrus kandleri]